MCKIIYIFGDVLQNVNKTNLCRVFFSDIICCRSCLFASKFTYLKFLTKPARFCWIIAIHFRPIHFLSGPGGEYTGHDRKVTVVCISVDNSQTERSRIAVIIFVWSAVCLSCHFNIGELAAESRKRSIWSTRHGNSRQAAATATN